MGLTATIRMIGATARMELDGEVPRIIVAGRLEDQASLLFAEMLGGVVQQLVEAKAVPRPLVRIDCRRLEAMDARAVGVCVGQARLLWQALDGFLMIMTPSRSIRSRFRDAGGSAGILIE